MAASQTYIRNTFALANRAIVWWLREIGEVLRLPARLRKKPKLEFEVSQNRQPLLTSSSDQVKPGSSKHVRLHFSDNTLLYRKIKLPVAAAKNINSVIGYEFNRYFPMNAEDAIYSFRILQPLSRSESVEIEIWAVSRSIIETILADIRSSHDIEIKTLTLADDDEDVLFYDIARQDKANSSPALVRKHRQLNVVLALLFLAVVLYPLFRIDQHIGELESQVRQLRQDAKPIQMMRDQLRDRQARIEALVDRKQKAIDQTYIWSRVTASLNGKAVLNRMSVSGNEVQLEGKAPSVEQLIKMLEANPDITNVVIIGPVEPAGDENYETMKIALTVY